MGTSKIRDMKGVHALFMQSGSVAMAYTCNAKDNIRYCELCLILAMACIIISFPSFFGHFLFFPGGYSYFIFFFGQLFYFALNAQVYFLI
jgi:hypothetical protein